MSNRFTQKLAKAPDYVKQHYAYFIRNKKAGSCVDKLRFLKDVLQTSTFEGEAFERLRPRTSDAGDDSVTQDVRWQKNKEWYGENLALSI